MNIVWLAKADAFLDPGHHMGLEKRNITMDQWHSQFGNFIGVTNSLVLWIVFCGVIL
jgi:hypothetical protein